MRSDLLLLADAVEKQEDAHFDMRFYVRTDQTKLQKLGINAIESLTKITQGGNHPCGTAVCAMGLTPTLWPDKFRWHHKGYLGTPEGGTGSAENTALKFFEIDWDEYTGMFMPGSYPPNVTKDVVAARIREVANATQSIA